ncbi:T cell receptor alpha chain MC.7.G5-like [Scyliorhinus torazame]|uniref:T cell receptor alpha chain MC.7.G5-like n=1 Tax=Scyliorhinus torazame TaxID=75743 RepID=UPI003B5905C1
MLSLFLTHFTLVIISLNFLLFSPCECDHYIWQKYVTHQICHVVGTPLDNIWIEDKYSQGKFHSFIHCDVLKYRRRKLNNGGKRANTNFKKKTVHKFNEWSHQDTVEQKEPQITAKEESNVTLTFTLKTSNSNPYAYWYSQQPGKAPMYMLRFIGENVQRNADLNDRFSSTFDKKNKTTELTISNAMMSDSAVYFCAMQPTLLQR